MLAQYEDYLFPLSDLHQVLSKNEDLQAFSSQGDMGLLLFVAD